MEDAIPSLEAVPTRVITSLSYTSCASSPKQGPGFKTGGFGGLCSTAYRNPEDPKPQLGSFSTAIAAQISIILCPQTDSS